MKFLIFISLSFFLTLQHTESKRILALQFFGSKSHVITYLPLLEELVKKGHEVTVVGPGKGLTKEKKIREIFTYDADIFMNGTDKDVYAMKEAEETPNPFTLLTTILPKYCRELYDRPELISLRTEEWDLILFQPVFNECSFGFVYKIMTARPQGSTPLVLFAPTSAPNFFVEYTGGYHPASFVSNMFLGYSDEMTFGQRFVNFGTNLMFDLIHSWYYLPVMEAIYREKIGQKTPSAREIMGQASLILSNGHFSISRPKPNLPNVVDVGGIHSKASKPLPKDLEDFVAKGGDHGFIFFSLGSGIRSDKMSPEKRAMFLRVFSRLKQQVVWKHESDIDNLPKNVYIGRWLPQQDLLGHPKIRFFMTHCGGGGTEEAIFHGTPLLGMPFHGDQPLNAQAAENHGYLVRTDWNELTEDVLMDKINELLNNPKYRENVQRLSKVFRGQVDSPLQRGVYWIEYIMRHNGAPHLQSAAKNLYRFQYHSLDVIATYLALIVAILLIFVKFVKMILWICGCGSKPANLKKN